MILTKGMTGTTRLSSSDGIFPTPVHHGLIRSLTVGSSTKRAADDAFVEDAAPMKAIKKPSKKARTERFSPKEPIQSLIHKYHYQTRSKTKFDAPMVSKRGEKKTSQDFPMQDVIHHYELRPKSKMEKSPKAPSRTTKMPLKNSAPKSSVKGARPRT